VYALVKRLYLQLEISSTGYTADLCSSNLLDIIARCLPSLRSIQNSIHPKLCNIAVYKCLSRPPSLRLQSISIFLFPLTLCRPLTLPKSFCPVSSALTLHGLTQYPQNFNPSLPQIFRYISLIFTSLYHILALP